ncbi:MAG: L,D-transpeptidase [Hyphomicrobiaceae bacterium]
MTKLDRRSVTMGLAAIALALPASRHGLHAASRVKDVAALRPGEFTWHPERSPVGPVAIIVSIPDQRVHVYRNGIRIAVSTCSTGKKGHETPTGVFTILQKDKNHHSSTYNNAPMPNMNRLTWSGVALHAGNLPGYPASHGCVRLPMKFSELLFSVTHVGTPVIIAGSYSDPKEVTHPGLILASGAQKELKTVRNTVESRANPWEAEIDDEPRSTVVLVSQHDAKAIVMENGEIVAEGPATIARPSEPLGRNVFILVKSKRTGHGFAWQAMSHTDDVARRHSDDSADMSPADGSVLQRIKVDKAVLAQIQHRMHPGMVLITTELPARPDTRTGKDFVLMDAMQAGGL